MAFKFFGNTRLLGTNQPNNAAELKARIRTLLDTSGSKCDNVYTTDVQQYGGFVFGPAVGILQGSMAVGSVQRAVNWIEEYLANEMDKRIKSGQTDPLADVPLSQRDFYDLHGWLLAEARSITHAGPGCNKQDRMDKAEAFVQKKFDNSSYQAFLTWYTDRYADRIKERDILNTGINIALGLLGINTGSGSNASGDNTQQPPAGGGINLAGLPWLQIILLASVGLGALIFIDQKN